jgi:flavin-binding protein dodecin
MRKSKEIKQPEIYSKPNKRSLSMSVAKVTEIIASSTKSFDDAIMIGVARAHKTLKNLKSAWVKNQQIMLDDEGQIREYRVQLKITFVIED